MEIHDIERGIFRLYIKGGAAVPLLLKEYNTFDLFQTFPYKITNDIDVECIIDPTVESDERQRIQKILMYKIVSYISHFFSSLDARIKDNIINEWTHAGFTYAGNYNGFINIVDSGFIGDDFSSETSKSYSALFEDAEFRGLRLHDSPFRIVVHPNYFFRETSLNMSIIKIHPMIHGEAGQSILDIVMPKISNDMIQWEWLSGAETILDLGYGGLQVPVADPYSVYIDQRVAEALNTREEKRAARKHRAELMKLYIFYPRTSQRVRTNLLKTRANVLRRMNVTLKNGRKPANIIKNTEWESTPLDFPLPVWYNPMTRRRRNQRRK